MSKIDAIYRRLLLTKFFTKGWGKPEDLLRIIALRQAIKTSAQCSDLVDADYPVQIDKDETREDHRLIEGRFTSPFDKLLPGIMPDVVRTATFQGIFPLEWSGELKPVVVHLAGTGDHFFWRRRSLLAVPMMRKYGIGAILLENPFYGVRKPEAQLRSSLHNVSDLFVMGGALILESAVLFRWCERNGFGPLGITGISMGGYMASLAASNWHKPVSLMPCLSWTTASGVFTDGVMSRAIPWYLLESQYRNNSMYKRQIWPRIRSPEAELMKQVSIYYQHTPELPCCQQSTETETTKLSQSKIRKVNPEVYAFMRTLLDEFTHLGNFPKPVDTDLVIVVSARKDAYVPVEGYVPLNELWSGIETRRLNNGHISSFLFQQQAFKDAIYDGMMKQIVKYHPDSSEAIHGLRAAPTPSKHKSWLPRKFIPAKLNSGS